jgi:hypothetical protein
LPEDNVADVVVAAVERVPFGAFAVRPIPGGEARYHPRLLLARESGLLGLGTVAIGGTKLRANASKLRSIRSDRATQLRAKLAANIAELTAKAEAADAAAEPHPQGLPGKIAEHCGLKDTLDAACARLKGQARAEAVAAVEAKGVELLVAIGRTQPHPACDVRPPPEMKPPCGISQPWRLKMQAKLDTADAKARYARRKQTGEPVFGIITSALGFTRFRFRGLARTAGRTLIALACNGRRLDRMRQA